MEFLKRFLFRRTFVQVLFTGVVIYIGFMFTLFVHLTGQGNIPGFDRPAGVEAFLPIGALVSLKQFLFTGEINRIHPAGLVLFLLICITALFAKKGFCSWICPIGFLSETLSKAHFMVFRKGFVLPVLLDRLLRSLKYIIAGFFIWIIYFQMPMDSVEQFIQSPYNRFSDITMLKFFTRMSTATFFVLVILAVLSVLVRNFWCRYLCPYGALLGLIGLFSLGGIRRSGEHCTGCGKCEKKCQGLIKIREKESVRSLECSACLECVKHCPGKDVLRFSIFPGKVALSEQTLCICFVVLFVLGIAAAKISGHWQNDISKQEYVYHGLKNTYQEMARMNK
jgi:polyferredoxin